MRSLRTALFWLVWVCACGSAWAKDSSLWVYHFGPEPVYSTMFVPGVVTFPAPLFDTMKQGHRDLAEIALLLTRDFYGDRKVWRHFPVETRLLEGQAVVWSELIGKLQDVIYARAFGPDFIVDQVKRKAFSLEWNGANPGGAFDILPALMQDWNRYPELGPMVQFPEYKTQVVEQLKELARDALGTKKPLVVIYDEMSTHGDPVDVGDGGDLVEPTFNVGPGTVQTARDQFRDAGAVWLSAVDDRGRVYVKGDHLYLRTPGEKDQKIDVFFGLIDVESADPSYTPQLERNRQADPEGKKGLSNNARLVGIPGLVKAWKKGKFIWVGGPTSMLTRTKVTPEIFEKIVREIETNAELREKLPKWARGLKSPAVPMAPGLEIYDPVTGDLREEVLEDALRNFKGYVFKEASGDGGKQVVIGADVLPADVESFSKKTWDIARLSSGNLIVQPLIQIGSTLVPTQLGPQTKVYYDTRFWGVISLSRKGNQVTDALYPVPMIRMHINKKVNVSSGGAVSLGVPGIANHVQFMKGGSLPLQRNLYALSADFYRGLCPSVFDSPAQNK